MPQGEALNQGAIAGFGRSQPLFGSLALIFLALCFPRATDGDGEQAEAVFQNIVRHAPFQAFDGLLFAQRPGHQNEWRLDPLGSHRFKDIHARSLWHPVIRQHHVIGHSARSLHDFFECDRHVPIHIEARGLQRTQGQFDILAAVFEEEHPERVYPS